MTSKVYFGSAHQARWEAEETLPHKLEVIMEKLKLRERVKDEIVALKMHLGSHLGYSTIHPVFVRKVVQAIKDGGGKPFVVDLAWDAISATERGYTPEVLGCPVYLSAGINDKYHYAHDYEYKNMKTWKLAGTIEDATFLVDFAHVKGHPSCGFGGVIKNLALGDMISDTRRAMHDVCHYDQYWFPEHCSDPETIKKIEAACPHHAIVEDREKAGWMHLHIEQCNQCGRCLQVAPKCALKIAAENFHSFQKACAISTKITLDTFAPGKAVFLNLATFMTPLCDCFGFTSMPILPDVGIFGSDDIVAVEQATLDMIGKEQLILNNIPRSMEVVCHEGHPFKQLHGHLKDPYLVVQYAEELGLGTRNYDLEDVMPVEEITPAPIGYVDMQGS